MKGTSLGEFEELVLLTIGVLDGNAYSLSVLEELKKRTGRNIMISAVHKVLVRLEDKGFLSSRMGGETEKRGGRMKKLYEVTGSGKEVLHTSRSLRNSLWDDAPSLSFE